MPPIAPKMKPQDARTLNMMDKHGCTSARGLEPATEKQSGFIIREEPAKAAPQGYVIVPAGEVMGRDIGRYIRFVTRFGHDKESRVVVIGELRQISMIGDGPDQVLLTVGSGGDEQYSLDARDLVAIYGELVKGPPLESLDQSLDSQYKS